MSFAELSNMIKEDRVPGSDTKNNGFRLVLHAGRAKSKYCKVVQIGLETVIRHNISPYAGDVSVFQQGHATAGLADEVMMPRLVNPLIHGFARTHVGFGHQAHLFQHAQCSIDGRRVNVRVTFANLFYYLSSRHVAVSVTHSGEDHQPLWGQSMTGIFERLGRSIFTTHIRTCN